MSNENRRQTRVKETCNLYRRIIYNIRKSYEIPVWLIRRIVTELTCFSKLKIDLNKFESCIAFAIYNGPCYAEITYRHMVTFLATKSCHKKLVQKEDLRVVNVSEGAGCDVIGFLNALSEEATAVRNLTLTQIDKVMRWQIFFSVTISEILAWSDVSPVSRFLNEVDLTFNFVQAEVGRWEDDAGQKAIDAIECADLVIMCCILAKIGGKQARQKNIQEVGRLMKNGALLYLGEMEAKSLSSWNFQEEFEVLYAGYVIGTVNDSTAILGCSCRQSCAKRAVILKKKESI